MFKFVTWYSTTYIPCKNIYYHVSLKRSGVFGRMILTIGASHGGLLAPVDFGHGDPVVVK